MDGKVTMISKVLRLLRIANDLSIKELSNMTGISASYITELENGNKSKPSLDIIDKYSKALNIKKTTIMFFLDEFEGNDYTYQMMLLKMLEKIAD